MAAARRLRPELTVVLAGGAAAYESAFAQASETEPAYELATDATSGPGTGGKQLGTPPVRSRARRWAGLRAAPARTRRPSPAPERPAAATRRPARAETRAAGASPGRRRAPARSRLPGRPRLRGSDERHGSKRLAHVLLAPDAEAGQPAGASLQQVLEGLRALPNDSRLGVARSIASLAYVLDRSVEVVEIGLQGGLRARSEPFGQGHSAVVSSHAVPGRTRRSRRPTLRRR